MAKVQPTSAAATKSTKPTKAPKEGAKERRITAKPKFDISNAPFEVAMPEGYDFSKFKQLKKKNFASTAVFFDHIAALYDWKAGRARAKAEDERKYGDKATRGNVKKLEKGIEKMADLIKTLRASGMDVSAFEAKLEELKAASSAEEGATTAE